MQYAYFFNMNQPQLGDYKRKEDPPRTFDRQDSQFGDYRKERRPTPPRVLTSQEAIDKFFTENWVEEPVERSVDAPQGLHYLSSLNKLKIRQWVDPNRTFVGLDRESRYSISNGSDQKVYWSSEESNLLSRLCIGFNREYNVKIMDNVRNEIIHLYRPFGCSSAACFCCLHKLKVFAPADNLLGCIEQKWSILHPKYVVKNQLGEILFKIKGPACTSCFCGYPVFKVFDAEGNRIGKVYQEWTGDTRKIMSSSVDICVEFPSHLYVKSKALLLGACYLMNFVYYNK